MNQQYTLYENDSILVMKKYINYIYFLECLISFSLETTKKALWISFKRYIINIRIFLVPMKNENDCNKSHHDTETFVPMRM